MHFIFNAQPDTILNCKEFSGLRLIELTLSVVVDRVNSVSCMWITAVKDKARVCYRGAMCRLHVFLDI